MITDEDLPAVKAIKEKVADEIRRRFQPDSLDIADKAAVLASSLDPRYRQRNFVMVSSL